MINNKIKQIAKNAAKVLRPVLKVGLVIGRVFTGGVIVFYVSKEAGVVTAGAVTCLLLMGEFDSYRIDQNVSLWKLHHNAHDELLKDVRTLIFTANEVVELGKKQFKGVC